MSDSAMTDPAKLLLLAALLAKDRIISNNAKAFLKELILRRDNRLLDLLKRFESKQTGDNAFMESIHDLIEDESRALYNNLFAETSLELGKTLSKEERDKKNLNNEKSLIYGEVDYTSFYRVLRKINPVAGGVFYDLGSGTGKAVFAARLTQDFSRCTGIEILQALHKQGRIVLEKYNTTFRQYLCSGQSQQVTLVEGSVLEHDWSDGDVVFANSTCFDDSLMTDLAKMGQSLKPGAFFVTFTKGLESPYFEVCIGPVFQRRYHRDTEMVLERKRYRMSWGPATVFIHRRLGEDGQPVAPARLNILPSDSRQYEDEEPIVDVDEEVDSDDGDEGNYPGPYSASGNGGNYRGSGIDLDIDEDVDLGSEDQGGEAADDDEDADYENEFEEDSTENENTVPPLQMETLNNRTPTGPKSSPAAPWGASNTPLSISLAQRFGSQSHRLSDIDRDAIHSPQDSALMRRKIQRTQA